METQLDAPIQTILRAFRFAAFKHRNQTLGDGVTPYFSHVVRVTWILRDLFAIDDQDIIVATILHDLIEDTATTNEEIATRFGPTIAGYVDALSKREDLPRKPRDEDYENKLLAAPEIVRIAKLADMFDNLSGRVGTPKQARTVTNAKRLMAIFRDAIKTSKGRKALEHVEQLIQEIENLPAPAAS